MHTYMNCHHSTCYALENVLIIPYRNGPLLNVCCIDQTFIFLWRLVTLTNVNVTRLPGAKKVMASLRGHYNPAPWSGSAWGLWGMKSMTEVHVIAWLTATKPTEKALIVLSTMILVGQGTYNTLSAVSTRFAPNTVSYCLLLTNFRHVVGDTFVNIDQL